MHDIRYSHQHELKAHDFLGCCKNCRRSLAIIKPHILDFARRIQRYSPADLAALSPPQLYRLYQLLDDLAHMEAGDHLADLILDEAEIREQLPFIRAYYTRFFSLHERHLANELLDAAAPWQALQNFPLYPRYRALIENQAKAMSFPQNATLLFLGSGPVPISLIIAHQLFGIPAIGLDSDEKSVALGRKVLARLGLDSAIRLIHGDESRLADLDGDLILVAALAEPKARIFARLRALLKNGSPRAHPPVICRTYTGMRAVLYQPIQAADLAGFEIVKTIHPTGRVNNTTLFLEPS